MIPDMPAFAGNRFRITTGPAGRALEMEMRESHCYTFPAAPWPRMEKIMNPSQIDFNVRVLVCACALALASCNPSSHASCNECGTVSEVKTITLEGKASGAGAVAGGVLGGVLGHQIGGGTGKDLATIGGAVGGAYAGHQIEKKAKERLQYRVVVHMENGTSRSFDYSSPTSFQVGDSVKIEKDTLVRP